MIWMMALAGCSTDGVEPGVAGNQIVMMSGAAVACRAEQDVEACHRMISENPNHEDNYIHFSTACRARYKDSCRLWFDHAGRRAEPRNQRSAMLFGCDGGDDTLCEELLKAADVTDNEKDRVFFREFVAKRRSTASE